MLIVFTMIALVAWLGFIWIADPDGFRRLTEAKRRNASTWQERFRRRS